MNGEARPRGIKRTQGEALDDDHRFAKRFNLLNLGAYLPLIRGRLANDHLLTRFL